MDMTLPPIDAAPVASNATFLLNTTGEAPRRWLERALAPLGQVHAVDGADPARDGIVERIGTANPGIVFLHFSADHAQASTRLGQQLARLFPNLPLVALGEAQEPELMLAALRAGVKDFVDMRSPAAHAIATVQRLLATREVLQPARRGKVLAVLGARPGVGATTLATNLAVAARRRQNGEVLLLDLGLPARDGALYTNVAPGFHFVEAVRNLRRFDQVFVQTALTRHAGGVAVLPLPQTLAELRDISFSEALALLGTLRSHFDLQVIDLGGFSNLDFMAQLVKVADEVLVVAEQSVAAIVSAAELLEELGRREAGRESMRLVVSRYQARLGLEAEQIAQRLELPLAGTLPDCRETMLAAMNSGAVLADRQPTAPYVRALAPMLERVGYRCEARASGPGWLEPIAQAVQRLRTSHAAGKNKADH